MYDRAIEHGSRDSLVRRSQIDDRPITRSPIDNRSAFEGVGRWRSGRRPFWLWNAAVTEHPLWHCPKCGARLVTRNLWHSCGRFTLEALFSGSAPGVLAAVLAAAQVRGAARIARRRPGASPENPPRRRRPRPIRRSVPAQRSLRRRLRPPSLAREPANRQDGRLRPSLARALRPHRNRRRSGPRLRVWLQESHDIVGMQSDLAGRHGRGTSRRRHLKR